MTKAESQENGRGEAEIRELFHEWFREAAAKDLDAVMARIADDAVSYEHDIPLQHFGSSAIRKVCAYGFEQVKGRFRWDMPELRVIVRGDIAVTWGLNRVVAQDGDGPRYESWSRATRIFQRLGDRWLMIHQHVSYPYDPATGQAHTDLRPREKHDQA